MGALVDVRKRESVVITSYLRRDRWLPNGSRMVLMSVVTPTLSHSELYRSTAIDVRYFSVSTEILIQIWVLVKFSLQQQILVALAVSKILCTVKRTI